MLIAFLVFLASFCFYGAIASHIDNKKLIAEIKRLDEEIKKAEQFIALQRANENRLCDEIDRYAERCARYTNDYAKSQQAKITDHLQILGANHDKNS
jgi:type VI protein secretion system component VasK